MAFNAPVNFSEVLNLESLGINGASVKFGSCTMESEKFVVVCEVLEGTRQLVIVDLQNGGSVTRKSMAAEAAIMNPLTKVIALRAGQQLQIFNLELQSKMKSHQSPEPIIFWRWITPNTIALVSATAVYHWKIDGDSAPTKIFDRHVNIGSNHQIINYSVSYDSQWCLLCGISQGEGGVIQGTMQLYSVEKAVSQILQGHIGTFSVFELPGRDPAQILSFFEKKPDSPAKLYVMEVGRDKDAPGGVFRVQPQIIPMPNEAANDFPVALQVGTSKGIVYMITKMGFLYLFDLYSAKTIYRAKISNEVVFATCQQLSSGGILGITVRTGRILHISINEQNLVPFIISTLNDSALAISLAGRLNLQGADDLYSSEFNRLISIGDIRAAALLAAESPRGILRTPQTIQIFQKLPPSGEGPQPLLQYFSVLLDKGRLNKNESLELVRPVIRQGRRDLVEKWLQDDKLEPSEELGDLIGTLDLTLALAIYLRANTSEKVINCLIQKGDFTKIVPYVNSVGYKCDFSFMLQTLVRSNPQGAAEFAKQLVTNDRPLIDLPTIIDIFMSVSRVQETTAILLEALKNNKPEEGFLQTKLLEINLLGGFPQVADAILQNNMFSHYDRVAVAKMCERAGLHQRALEHYTDISDIKRAMNFGAGMSPEFIIAFFARLSPEVALEVLRDMLGKNMRTNLNIVVQVASKYYEHIGSAKLIQMFEEYKCNEGLFYFLSAIVNFSQEPIVHLKFIQAATKMGQIKEVERVCRDSQVYNPQEVKDFLIESKLPDPRPLIHVCDRFDFVEELTGYLYSNNLHKYIEVYVQKVSPQKTPQVIGKLLDVDCNEDFIRSLLNYVGSMCPVDELVEQVERRNRLRILQPWLEAMIATGNTETPTHNAIGKIYVTLNRDPVKFLENNQFYDPKVIGAYCEKLDPSLAVIAYRRAGGECDDELLRVTFKNGLYKAQARYLLEKQDITLWGRVLQSNDGELTNMRALIDQVVQSLPETKNPDEVSCTVRAFLDAGLERELIELLERIVLQGSDFSDNKNLQNLLILTAMKADPSRVMDYINRLDNFDGHEIAKIAKNDPYELYEEAFAIYVKSAKKANDDAEREELHVCAIEVLVLDLHDVSRGQEFAQRVNEKRVWSKLAEALMRSETICEAMQAFIKADDPSVYDQVIELAQAAEEFETLVSYLRMARKQVKQSKLDTALIYSFAKIQKLGDLEEFLSAPNVADIQGVGESCFNEGMFEAAKLLFKSNNNNAKLALCYLNLGRFREAVEAAQKANAIATWKQVNRACVEAGEFRLAATCGLKIIIHPDHLEELINHYESAGYVEELMQLLEQGLGLEDAHTGIFTELGVLYSKYKSKKLMEHITIFFSRLNVSKLLRACERSKLWNEVVFLYKEDKQYDSAVRTMIDHPVSFQIELFLDCVQKVRNAELHYMAIGFFLEQHPLDLEKLLQILTPQLDHSRVVNQLKRHDHIPLAVNYLKSVQKENIAAVNSALNELYIEEEEIELLRLSIEEYDNFDQIALARHIESHELIEFRRIAAHLYKRNKRWSQSVELSKSNKMYKDAIDTTSTSQDPELVENLLKFFVSQKNKECFCATLYTCYSLVRPDIAVELAWRNGYVDFVMPFMIQYLRHTHEKIRELDTRTAVKQTETSTEVANAVASQFMLNNNLLLTNGPSGFDTGFNSNMMMGGNPGMSFNPVQPPQAGFYGYPPNSFGGAPQW